MNRQTKRAMAKQGADKPARPERRSPQQQTQTERTGPRQYLSEVRGEMKSIATAVPGLRVGEHLPNIAGVMDRGTVVRSMCHPYPLHGVAYAVSGIPTYTPALETQPRATEHWPFIGSVVDYLEERGGRGGAAAVPRNVGLPWLLAHRRRRRIVPWLVNGIRSQRRVALVRCTPGMPPPQTATSR